MNYYVRIIDEWGNVDIYDDVIDIEITKDRIFLDALDDEGEDVRYIFPRSDMKQMIIQNPDL